MTNQAVFLLKRKEKTMFDNLSISIENFETKDFYNLIENHVKKYPKKRTEGWFQSDWQNLRINYINFLSR